MSVENKAQKPWIKPAAIVGTVLLGTAIAVGAATRGEPTPTQPPATETPSAAAASPTPEKTVAPTPVRTPEVTPSPTPTPEVKKEVVPCNFLAPELCSKGELIKWKDEQGREFIYIGFNLPAGTAIFTPVDGQVSKAKINQPSPFQGFFAGMQDRSQNPPVSYSLNGDLQFPNLLSENVKAGQNIGSITNTGTKSFENYNLVVGVSRPDLTLGRFVSAEDILRKLFPTAFEKEAKQVSFEGTPAGTIVKVFETQNPQSRP